MQTGIYEKLINKLVLSEISKLNQDQFYIKKTKIDKSEAAKILGQYLANLIKGALSLITGDDSIEKQISLANKVIYLIKEELQIQDFDDDLISVEAKILSAVFSKIDADVLDFNKYLKHITPYSRLSHSELFTGSNSGISLESEIKKEILSADKINFLVSFIKWTGIRIFENELIEFTERGGKLQVITTTYMGATDSKAIEFLASLKNTEIKVSYNTNNERLHAKAYLFYRNTGFHTGYIGSSNLSRSALTNGLEWNLKITTQEIPHIIDKFQKTFDTYWQDKEFEFFDKKRDVVRIKKALKQEKKNDNLNVAMYFDIKPYPYQEQILEKLTTERNIHNRLKTY